MITVLKDTSKQLKKEKVDEEETQVSETTGRRPPPAAADQDPLNGHHTDTYRDQTDDDDGADTNVEGNLAQHPDDPGYPPSQPLDFLHALHTDTDVDQTDDHGVDANVEGNLAQHPDDPGYPPLVITPGQSTRLAGRTSARQ